MSPTMVDTFGFRSPVPNTMKMRPRKNEGCSGRPTSGAAIVKWPSAMMTPPTKTALRCPQRLSATHPPGSEST